MKTRTENVLLFYLAHYFYVADTTVSNFCGPTGLHASDYSFHIDKFLTYYESLEVGSSSSLQ